MKTRTISLIATSMAVAMLLLGSCKKDNGNNQGHNGVSFKAMTEHHDSNAKTYLDGENIKWIAGDAIRVVNGNGQVAVFATEEGNSQTATFYTGDEDFTFTPEFDAAYPSNATIDNGLATFVLPSSQTITTANTFADGSMPMVAHSATNSFSFRNVCGGICFPLKGEGITVTKIVLTSNDPNNDKLWGTFKADCSSSEPLPTNVENTESGYEITLNCGENNSGIALTATDQYFYIMLPPGTLEKGFTLKIYDGTTVLYNRTIDWSENPTDGFITRSIVSMLSTALDLVKITTISPTFITKNSALGMGMINVMPSACGILYAKASDLGTPATDLVIGGTNVIQVAAGTVGKRFDVNMPGVGNPDLEEDTEYFVRAYAVTESNVVYYGNPIPFSTRKDYDNLNGTLSHLFSVSASNRVYFSKANLQYTKSTNQWNFMDQQYRTVETTDLNVGENYSNQDIISLFGWGTSGYNHGATCYQPGSTVHFTDHAYDNYYAYGVGTYNLYNQTGQADWGYNKIRNGGNTEGMWRTLTGGANGEWKYLLDSRNKQYRYAIARIKLDGNAGYTVETVNGVPACGKNVNGMIIFPDDFSWPVDVPALELNNMNKSVDYSANSITEAQWTLLEKEGCVFLPAGGRREGTTVLRVNTMSYYWGSTYDDSTDGVNPVHIGECANDLYFTGYGVNPDFRNNRSYGFCVRLVRNEF